MSVEDCVRDEILYGRMPFPKFREFYTGLKREISSVEDEGLRRSYLNSLRAIVTYYSECRRIIREGISDDSLKHNEMAMNATLKLITYLLIVSKVFKDKFHPLRN